MLRECADRGTDYDNHWELDPLCQVCNLPHKGFDEEHTFIAPTEPLIWGENTWRKNACPGWEYDENGNTTQCSCPCHWGAYYVNVYQVDRAYGGPEEGGWYYDCGYPIAAVPFDSWKEATDFRETWLEKYPRTGRRNSVLDGEDYEIYVQNHFAKEYPEEIPHYE